MFLDDHFDRIVLLSLAGASARRERALSVLRENELTDRVQLVTAIAGSELPPPAWWRAGNGAWGCFCSHRRALEDAWQDGVQRLLVLEDDIVANPVSESLRDFFAELPAGWGQVYLGGQHQRAPERHSANVLRCRSVNRTHAVATSRETIKKVLAHIQHAPDYLGPAKAPHIDHQLEKAHRRGDWTVYGPNRWLFGQGENHSDINGRAHPEKWWHHAPSAVSLPLVYLEPDTVLTDWHRKHLHFGFTLEPTTAIDAGVRASAGKPSSLRAVYDVLAREAWEHQRVPAVIGIWPIENFREAWPQTVHVDDAQWDYIENLCQYPQAA